MGSVFAIGGELWLGMYIRVVVLVDVLDVEVVCSEIEYITLVVGLHVVGGGKSADQRFSTSEDTLEIRRFVLVLHLLLGRWTLVLSH